MKVVLDTNALVSGLLSPYGPCGEILGILVAGGITLCVDARILLEYEEVLRRPKFKLSAHRREQVLDYIRGASEVHAALPLHHALPDPDDAPFLEVALAAGAAGVITGNLKHYPARCREGLRVFSPAEFVEYFRRNR